MKMSYDFIEYIRPGWIPSTPAMVGIKGEDKLPLKTVLIRSAIVAYCT